MKKCNACGKTKKNNDFGICAKNKDGRNIYCKPCQNSLYAGKKVAQIREENGFKPRKKRNVVRRKKVFTGSIPVEPVNVDLASRVKLLEELVAAQKQIIEVLLSK